MDVSTRERISRTILSGTRDESDSQSYGGSSDLRKPCGEV